MNKKEPLAECNDIASGPDSKRLRLNEKLPAEKLGGGDMDANAKENEDPAQQKEFQFSERPTMEEIRNLQAKFVTERGWEKFHTPRNVLLAMVGEVGEISELFQWKGECKRGLPDWTDQERTSLSDELSDVLIYLLRLSDLCEVDLPTVVLEKLKKNAKKYPADKVFGSCKKYNEYD